MARIAQVWNERAQGLITELKLQIERSDPDGVQLRMPYNPEFCADEGGTLLHGGVLTALLDSAFGLANFLAVENLEAMATLDLRVEYLSPAQSRADLLYTSGAGDEEDSARLGGRPLIKKPCSQRENYCWAVSRIGAGECR